MEGGKAVAAAAAGQQVAMAVRAVRVSAGVVLEATVVGVVWVVLAAAAATAGTQAVRVARAVGVAILEAQVGGEEKGVASVALVI